MAGVVGNASSKSGGNSGVEGEGEGGMVDGPRQGAGGDVVKTCEYAYV